MYSRCACLFWVRALSRVACTRSGCPDRNTCTACRNAVRSRTWDRALLEGSPAVPCRTGRNARLRGYLACSPALVPCCSRAWLAVREPAFPRTPCVASRAGRDPDIHAGDIWLPQNLLTESLVNHEGH